MCLTGAPSDKLEHGTRASVSPADPGEGGPRRALAQLRRATGAGSRPQDRDVRPPSPALVGARRLAERVIRAGRVEHVIDDLEQQPELCREPASAPATSGPGAASTTAQPTEASSSAPVFNRCRRWSARLVDIGGRTDVQVLPTDHPGRTRRSREQRERGEPALRRPGLPLGEQLERSSQQRVADEDRHVLAVAHVASSAARGGDRRRPSPGRSSCTSENVCTSSSASAVGSSSSGSTPAPRRSPGRGPAAAACPAASSG